MVIHSVVELFIIFATYSVIHAFIYMSAERRGVVNVNGS